MLHKKYLQENLEPAASTNASLGTLSDNQKIFLTMLEKINSACFLGAIPVLFREALGFSLKTFNVEALPIKDQS